ncbi:MAG TPA: hypothetical protein PKM57_03510 [Kiritimatiellia bacterium]|nr:hypothetical protein [Kiritimatiellia bacterium]HPS06332.1 hypothetical protein [Kiritimatiellia bacterium]
MAKSDVIAILAESACVRGVRFAPRGRDGWTRTGGGVWPLDVPHENESAEEGEQSGTLVESDKPLARAFGAAKSEMGARQVVLALPLSRLLVRVLRLPIEVREDLADAVVLQMDKLSPFPGEELAVGCEVLSETEKELWVLAAAMPAAVFEELGAALQVAKLHVVRTDAAALGWFRSLCGPCQLARPGRRVVLMNPDDGWDLLVLDHGVPVLVRGLGALPDDASLIREVTLSLLNAELDAGEAPVAEVLVVSKEAPPPELMRKLETLAGAAVRHVVPPSEDGGVEGVAVRTGEGAALDLTPQAWRDEVRESRVRRRVLLGVGVAMAVWAVFMGVLFSGPLVYKQMTSRTRSASKVHAKAFKQVSDTRERVNLILAYTDRTYSALEMLLMASSYLPSGITLIGFNYRRDDGVKIAGEADQPTLVYDFKNAVTEDPLFETVSLTGPSASKGKHKFEVDAKFKGVTRK